MVIKNTTKVRVHREVLPEVFPEGLSYYGSRAIASLNEDNLLGLARKVWEEERVVHPINEIVLIDIRKKIVGQKALFYAVSVAYQLDHTTR